MISDREVLMTSRTYLVITNCSTDKDAKDKIMHKSGCKNNQRFCLVKCVQNYLFYSKLVDCDDIPEVNLDLWKD